MQPSSARQASLAALQARECWSGALRVMSPSIQLLPLLPPLTAFTAHWGSRWFSDESVLVAKEKSLCYHLG